MDIALSAGGHYNPCVVALAFCGNSPTHLDMFKRIKKHPNVKHGLLTKSATGKKKCECN